jgi:hypothetical protein
MVSGIFGFIAFALGLVSLAVKPIDVCDRLNYKNVKCSEVPSPVFGTLMAIGIAVNVFCIIAHYNLVKGVERVRF